MKTKRTIHWSSLLSAGLVLAGSLAVSQAQPYTNYVVDQFDTDTTGNFANNGWGTAFPVVYWDTPNATTIMGPNTPGSGSAKWEIMWTTASGDQFMVTRWFDNGAVIDFNQYTNVSFDIKFDPNSALDGPGTSYGGIEFGAIPQSDGWPSTALGVYTSAVANGNGWIHVSIPINAASNSKFKAVRGYYVKMQQNRTGTPLANGVATQFWLDNVVFGGNTNVILPPKLTISPLTVPPGLMIMAGGSGGTYTRGLVMAFDPINGTRNFSWVGMGTTPVTYSQTIASYPGTNYAGFESLILLVPSGNFGDPGIDYDASTVAQLAIRNNADGTATGAFQFKTNQPSGNSGFTSYGNVGSITCPSAIGTWSLTFTNDTNVIVRGPGNQSVSLTIPPEVAAMFGNPLSVFMGNQQNGDGNMGQYSTYSQFKISGITASPAITDNFTQTTLNTTNWGRVDYSQEDIYVVQPTDKYLVKWTLPDAGFGLLVTTNLANKNSWVDPGASNNIMTTTAGNMIILPGMATNLPAGSALYVRMKK